MSKDRDMLISFLDLKIVKDANNVRHYVAKFRNADNSKISRKYKFQSLNFKNDMNLLILVAEKVERDLGCIVDMGKTTTIYRDEIISRYESKSIIESSYYALIKAVRIIDDYNKKLSELNKEEIDVWINGRWDIDDVELGFESFSINVYDRGFACRVKRIDLDLFIEQVEARGHKYLIPSQFSNPRWNGQINFIKTRKINPNYL